MMVSVIVPIYNILAVTTLEVFRGGKPDPVNILRKLATNPLILGAAAGIIAVLGEIKLPSVLETVVSDMSAVAMPMALVILGASFNITSIERCRKNLVICVIARLIVVPAAGLGAAAFLISRYRLCYLDRDFRITDGGVVLYHGRNHGKRQRTGGELRRLFLGICMFYYVFWIFLYKNLGMF